MQDEKTVSEKAIASLRSDPDYAKDNPFKDQLESDMADPTTGVADAWVKNGWTLDRLASAVTSYARAKMKSVSGFQTSETVFGWMRHIIVENEKAEGDDADEESAPKPETKPQPVAEKAAPIPKQKKEKTLSKYVQESLFEELSQK